MFTATVFICSLNIYIMTFVFKDVRLKLKEGTVQVLEIGAISTLAPVKEKRKRICRALLGVQSADSVLADTVLTEHIEEQTFGIFMRWKQSKGSLATYEALAKALLDRTVKLNQVVADFCLAIQGGEEN